MKHKLNILFEFDHTKYSAPYHALATHLVETGVAGKLGGIVVATSPEIFESLDSQSRIKYEFLDRFEQLEYAAVTCPPDYQLLSRWESAIGIPLMTAISADRELGNGFHSEGQTPNTKLRMLVRRDKKVVDSYLTYMVRHIEKRLDEFRPDIVIIAGIGSAFLLLLFWMCRSRGIPCLWPMPSRIMDRWMLTDNESYIGVAVRRRCEEILAGDQPNPGTMELSIKYLADFRNEFSEGEYFASRFGRSRAALRYERNVARTLASIAMNGIRDFAVILLNPIDRKRAWPRYRSPMSKWWFDARHILTWRKYFKRHIHDDNRLPEQFIYFPLQVTPEASTMAMAPLFSNALPLIEVLAKVAPVGVRIIVKEHRPMIGRRPAWFYERINGLPNVDMVNPLFSSSELISHAKMTVTITSTAAWESAMLRTPALMFGAAPFSITGLIHTCTDFSKLGDMISGIIKEELSFSESEREFRLLSYISATLENSFEMERAELYGHSYLPGEYPLGSRFVAGMADQLERIRKAAERA